MKKSVLMTGFLAVLLIGFGAAYMSVPWLVGIGAKHVLADKGFHGAKLEVKSVGFARAVIENIDLGSNSSIRAKSLTVDYALERVFEGTIDGLAIDELEVPIGLNISGVDLGPLSVFLNDEGEGSGLQVRGPIKINEGLLRIASPMGEVVAAIDGDLLLTDGLGSQAHIEFALQHPKARVSGRLRGILDASNQLQLTLDIQDAASEAEIQFAEMAGAINIRGYFPAALSGGGSLSLKDVIIEGVNFGHVDLVGDIKGRAAEAEFLLGGAGTGLSLQLRAETDDLIDPQSLLRLSGEMATDGLKGPFKLPGNIDLVGAVAFDIKGARKDLQILPGRIQSGAVRTTGDVSGWIDVSQLGINLPEREIDATINGKASLLIDQRGWRIQPFAGINFDAGMAARGAYRRVETTFETIDGAPFLIGGPNRTDPLRIAMGFDGVFADWLPFSGDAGGIIWPSTTDGVVFEDFAIRFDPWQMRLQKLEFATEAVTLRLSGTASNPSLTAGLDASLSGEVLSGYKIRGGSISLKSQIGYGKDGIRVYPQGCANVRATQLIINDAILRPGPIALCPDENGGPLFHAIMGPEGLKRIDFASLLKATEFEVKGVGEYSLSGTSPSFAGTGSFDATRGTWWAKALPKGGDIRIEGPDIAIAGLEGVLSFEGREKILGAKFNLTKGKIVDHRRPLRFTPIAVRGLAGHRSGSIDFKGHVGFDGGPEAQVNVRHRYQNGRGHFEFKLPQWTILTGKTQPQDLIPLLRGHVTDVSGAITADARINWSGARMTSTGSIGLANVGFGTTPAAFSGINGTVVFDDLLKLKSKGEQTLKIGSVDAGLPLRAGNVRFDLPGDSSLKILTASWPLAGGTISFRDVNIPFDTVPSSFVATIKSLDAKEIARSIDIKDLEAEGNFEGSVPIRITDTGPVIDNARIWTNTPGVLRFRSEAAVSSLKQSGEMAELLAKALANFQYSDIDVSLDGPLSGDITATAKIKGANPDLYDGKKIELNVNLHGALRDLMQSASVFRDLPETIRDRVQGPSGKP